MTIRELSVIEIRKIIDIFDPRAYIIHSKECNRIVVELSSFSFASQISRIEKEDREDKSLARSRKKLGIALSFIKVLDHLLHYIYGYKKKDFILGRIVKKSWYSSTFIRVSFFVSKFLSFIRCSGP